MLDAPSPFVVNIAPKWGLWETLNSFNVCVKLRICFRKVFNPTMHIHFKTCRNFSEWNGEFAQGCIKINFAELPYNKFYQFAFALSYSFVAVVVDSMNKYNHNIAPTPSELFEAHIKREHWMNVIDMFDLE